jgi:hypothetical protein
MRATCSRLGCGSYAIWTDVDDDRAYCGAHAVLVIDDADVKEKRRDFAAEYKRDADREART